MGFANFVLLTRLHMFQTTAIALSLQSDLNRVNP